MPSLRLAASKAPGAADATPLSRSSAGLIVHNMMHDLAEFRAVDGDKIWVLYEFDGGAKLLEFKTHILNHASKDELGQSTNQLGKKALKIRV
jgi:hypothetical protein